MKGSTLSNKKKKQNVLSVEHCKTNMLMQRYSRSLVLATALIRKVGGKRWKETTEAQMQYNVSVRDDMQQVWRAQS